MTSGQFLNVFFHIGIVIYSEGITLYEPTFISEWKTVKAQDDKKCELYISFPDKEFPTRTTPVKVIVEVKVEDGGESFIFNAFGSSPRDDDSQEKYGGVVYFYNATGVLIFLTNEFERDPNDEKNGDGKAVYLGEEEFWYKPTSHLGNEIKKEVDDANVRVKMWRQDDLPPQFDSGFIYTMKSRQQTGVQDNTYLEVPINLTSSPDMVVVQAAPEQKFDEMPGLISEGSGLPGCLRCGDETGGLSFAYNDSHVRLWVKLNYPITSAADGWGDKDYPTPNRLMSYEVKVRILAWTFDNAVNACQWKETSTTDISDSVQTTPKMVFPREVVIEASLVMASIRPVDGPNRGFSFYGTGSIVNSGNYDGTGRYTGLVFGYNTFGVYVWRVKPSPRAFVFDIDSPWGSGNNNQRTNDVIIDIIALGMMSRGTCNDTDLTIPKGTVNEARVRPCRGGKVTCDYGFHYLNSSFQAAHCQLNAVWNTNIPECIETFCPNEDTPDNSTVVSVKYTVDGELVHACDPGFYLLAGNLSRFCLPNGTWSGDPPVCEEILCPALTDPTDGTVVLISGRSINDEAVYNCNPGFEITGGNLTRTCLDTGIWNGIAAVCTEVFCPILPNPSFGTVTVTNPMSPDVAALTQVTVNASATFSCTPGFTLSEVVVLTCLITGSWNGTSPDCSPIVCPDTVTPPNITLLAMNREVNGTLQYSCLPGFYNSAGNLSRTCMLDGQWSGDPPVCSEILCPALTDPTDGTVVLSSGRSVNDEAVYNCNSGFEITDGNLTRTCLDTGIWNGIAAVCTEVFCPILPNPSHGTVTVTHPMSPDVAASTQVPVNASATFSCTPGFVLSEVVVLTCLVTGSWNGTSPDCFPILCPETVTPPNATLMGLNTEVNGTVQYSCLPGFYNSAGNLSRTCMLDGQWSGDPPVCSEILCPSLTPPPNGGLIQDTSIGGTAKYSCNPGFQFAGGNSYLTCQDDGTWSGDPILCIEILCPAIKNPENGKVTLLKNISMTNTWVSGVPVNTSASFSCNPGYYIAASESIFERTCLINGSWDGAPFSCSEILCPELVEEPNTTITHMDRSINGTVNYKCNKGYILANGSLQRKCMSSGKWDGRPPNCTALGECMCPCSMVHEPKYTDVNDKALIRAIEEMQEELVVLETSAALRKKISVKDFRPSTNASGTVWVVFLLTMAAFIVVPDMLSAFRHEDNE
ncbi:sushi, von Willebrand factor type A, EGF and pentraxin domain-containing protein 1-like [Saccostrea cucullata]|uniref:sushi, von Willebrand factor type A, EGF and pentraxin domain-containing protein 1-like n=1 Tax=Saccostrea cuccullata TaxID=36930 RepID=UPI002ED0D82C